jgi:alpha-galactosidase
VLALPGYTQATGRHQLVLNLNIPEAFDYLVERMSWLLGEHAVDYVKWDMNRELVQPGHKVKPPPMHKRASSIACWMCWVSASRILNLNPALPAADASIMRC